ncbi:hypothetical protein SXCC_00646 [Gluconacetobacter sp. SXCC-1]|nr:hypothetical protein SXCC_00646 [Gluconacetobacter sp. SXCC-1]
MTVSRICRTDFSTTNLQVDNCVARTVGGYETHTQWIGLTDLDRMDTLAFNV